MTELSVVVCTYNRPYELRLCLEGLARQEPASCEFIIVDNAPAEEISSLVDSFARQLAVRYVAEPRIGLSHARRTGWQEANSELVAYLDDDAVARPDYAQQLIHAFTRAPSDVVCVGGRIDLVWPQGRPSWVQPWMENFYSGLDLGDRPRALTNTEAVWGCNMAFRRSFLREVSAFSEPLGRTGTRLLSGEDYEIQRQARELGYRCWYAPAVIVEHLVADDRVSARWLQRRMFWEGASDALLARHNGSLSKSERYRLAREQIQGKRRRLVRGLVNAMRRHPPDEPFLDIVVLSSFGYLWGLVAPELRNDSDFSGDE